MHHWMDGASQHSESVLHLHRHPMTGLLVSVQHDNQRPTDPPIPREIPDVFAASDCWHFDGLSRMTLARTHCELTTLADGK